MKRFALSILFVATFFITSPRLEAQDKSEPAKGEITVEKQRAIIDSLVKAIDDQYLYQDRVQEIEKELLQQLEAGAYNEAKTSFAYAMKLTDALRSFTKDKHFGVRYSPNGETGLFGGFQIQRGAAGEGDTGGNGQGQAIRIGGPGGAQLDPDSQMFKILHEQFRNNNFSMPKLEVLPGNVGYFRLDMMPPLDVAKPTLDAAMAFLANTDAMIIDLRDTPGGVGGFIPYLMSYFFPEGGKLLYTRYFGAEDRADRYTTSDEVGGKRLPDLPPYILTNRGTGSAAENLAYTLKNHGRATTIGENTAGAGHSATMVSLIDGFSAMIPIADVIHPVTKSGFDGVGVKPNVAVSAAEALDKAHELALEKLIEIASTTDKTTLTEKTTLVTTLAELLTSRELRKKNGTDVDTAAFEIYVGTYGARTVYVEGSKLRYRRQGGPAIDLVPISDDTFRLRTPSGVRSALALPNVRFERDADDNIKGFSLVRDDKVEEFVEKAQK